MDCSKVEKITDVTDQIGYIDTKSGGQGDSEWVSCGQDGSYNELQNKFDKHFKGITTESWMSKSMCACCKSLKPTGKEKVSWLKFYKCLLSKASETTNTFTKINELIKWHEARV